MKTVLILCPNISGLGGVEKVVIHLANALCKSYKIIIGTLSEVQPSYKLDRRVICYYLKDCKYKHTHIISFFLRKLIREGRIHFKRKNTEKLFYPRYRIRNFCGFAEERKISSVIGVGIDMTLIATFMKQENETINVIGWQHNEYKLYFEEPGKYYYGLSDLFKARAGYIDKNIVLTKKEEQIFSSKLGVTSQHIYNPVCIDYKLGLSPSDANKKNILFVGRIVKEQKGIDFLLEILDRTLKKKNANGWKAIIVGEGPDLDYLKNEVKAHKLESYIEITGGVNNVADYYQSSSILLSTSRWEGFGLVISEALLFGLTVISFNNEGPAEIIQDDYNGYLIPKYDIDKFIERLEYVISSESIRRYISLNAKNSATRYLPEKIYNIWEEIIL